MTQWRVSNGDILDAEADGLICSANPNLNLSGGVGGAFLLRYGTEMQSFLHEHLRLAGKKHVAPGTAVLAPSCGSRFKAVSHAVAIDAFYDTNCDFIRTAYCNSINQLAEASCRTIVASCLACGYGRSSISQFVESVAPLVAVPFPRVDTITLMTTNAQLADAIATAIGAAKC
jgi:O-acetyl-ADP-ribose deacetylase (regulator of RNase III)